MALNLLSLVRVDTSLEALKRNFASIVAEFKKVQYRDGSTPLEGNLDLNGNRIINYPDPVGDNDLVTYGAAKRIIGSDVSALNAAIDAVADDVLEVSNRFTVTALAVVNDRLIVTYSDGSTQDVGVVGGLIANVVSTFGTSSLPLNKVAGGVELFDNLDQQLQELGVD